MSRLRVRRRFAVAAAAAAVPIGLVGVATTALPAAADTPSGPVTVRLDPLKGSDAHGTAVLTPLSNGSLRVQISGSGYTPNMPHAQHIHGDTTGKHYFCPPASADKNGNGFISIEEGLPMYGNIDISLTTKGDTSMKSGLAVDRMPVADSHGNLSYTRTLTPAELGPDTLSHLDDLHIVQHGVDANHNNKYDLQGLGESSFAKSLGVKGIPEEATDGATCGMIMPTGADTGGTSTAGIQDQGMLAGGLITLVGAGGIILARRRFASAR